MRTDPTAATEAALDIESIKEVMDGFDPASLLPELETIFTAVAGICRIAVLIGPIILLVLGISYLFLAPREANYYFGYRCYFGMGSVEAWRFTQRFSGIVLGALGLILTIVMFVLSAGFPSLTPEEMVWKAFWCLVWQAILSLLANIAVWAVTALRFDAKGNLRRKK